MQERLDLLIGEKIRKELQKKTVMIIGLGGVGGYAVETLTRMGIGNFILVDPDRIEESNFNRQMIAVLENIGRLKTEAFQDRILSISKDCQVLLKNVFVDTESIESIFQHPVDFVIDACDTILAKKLIIKRCIDQAIPFISSMGVGKRIDPTKVVISSLDKTSGDPIAKVLRKWAHENHLKNIPVVFSTEIPKKIEETAIASCVFPPATAGILLAYYAYQHFVGEK